MSYRIDLTPNASYTETVSVSQDDVGREIAVDLYLDGTAYTPTTGTTITMQGTKPSGLGYTITGTASGSSVTFLTTLEMTQEAGRFASEIVLTNGSTVIGTANFALYVEKNPHPENTIDGTEETMQNLTVRMDALEDRVEEIEQGGDGLTDGVKAALLQIAQKVAYIDDEGQTYYGDLYNALYAVTAVSVSPTTLNFSTLGATQQLTATTTPSGATVTWASSNTSIATVDSTGLVTSVAYGSATITATAGGITASCSVVVAQATLTSITAVYTQSGTVYDTDSLDSLKSDLVVTAYYNNSTSAVVPSADYTLSGTLAEGTSTVTVSYGGKTDTFSVTVSHDMTYSEIVLATLVPDDNLTYSKGTIAASTGEVTLDESSSYNTSDLIAIPVGTTSFSYRMTKLDSNTIVAWYDSEQVFAGNGYGAGTYSGTATYGDAYTDANGYTWHSVPATARYCRIQWRPSDNTLTALEFKHNIKLDESVTPVANVVYYYTFSSSSTSANTDDYLPCAEMAYAHSRNIYRRGYTLYDADKIAVSTQSVANNIGNNIAIASDAKFIRLGNTTNTSTSNTAITSRNGIGLIMFSDESLTSW